VSESESFESAVPAAVWDAWQAEIQAIGVTNPLINFERSSYGQIDLTQSHPGGFSQLTTGRATTLSNLVRDPMAFSSALGAARRIKNKADKISLNFGIEALGLLGGLVNLQADGFDLQLPILYWPVHLIHKGEDYEIELAGTARVNPALIDAFKNCYGVQVDPREILSRASQSTDLLPVSILNYLAELVSGRARLDLQKVLVITNFTTAPIELSRDFSRDANAVIKSLASDHFAGALPVIDQQIFTLVADADEVQKRIVSRALLGQSFAVETLPGCGYTQSVINLVSALVEQGKRVVVAAGRQQTLNELADRFSALGLGGLGVRSNSAWIDLISTISRHEKAEPVDAAATLAERNNAQVQIEAYFATLNRKDPEYGYSIGEALSQLAKLSAMPHAPETSARIEPSNLLEHRNRERAVSVLQRAEELGEFRYGPQDSAWYQAKFESPLDVAAGVQLATRLRETEFDSLQQHMTEFTDRVKFKPAATVEDWGKYLRLFLGIRDTLDRFVPDVFDRPLTDLITATAPRKETGVGRGEMSGGNRRRLKKLAKEYLRPGMHVQDMNEALRQIQAQREQWHTLSYAVTAPQVPLGLADVQVVYQAFVADLDNLEKHLDPESNPTSLVRLPLETLRKKLDSLVADTAALNNYGERALVAQELESLGLTSLKRDFAKLHVTREQVAAEFDLAWWQSLLEVLVQRDASILSFSAEQLDLLEKTFSEADAELIAKGPGMIAKVLADRWHSAIAAEPAQTAALKEALKARQISLPLLNQIASGLLPAVAPVVMVSPFEAPGTLTSQRFDVAVIMDGAVSTVAENLSVLRRSSQVVVFGDDAIAAAEGFEVENRLRSLGRTVEADSIYDVAKKSLGVETLRISYRTSGQTLGGLVNREFYQNRIVYEPTPDEFEGKKSHSIEIITEGANASSTIDGATESPEAEVRRVVDLVLNHALWHPHQSLVVASASQVHADRIKNTLQKELKTKPDLATFFDAHGREKFEVVGIADLAHRIADRIIFTVGFGLTPGGGVSSDFGQLSGSNGRRYLANALVSARKQITVVSCITAEVIPADGLSSGAHLLKTLLSSAEDGGHVPGDHEGDPMLGDLAKRLKRLGVRVDASFAERLPLVAAFADKNAVIVPDWTLRGESWSEKLRLRPALLRAMGWKYIRVHSFDLFADPQAVAHRIAEDLGMQLSKQPQALFDQDRAYEDTDMAWGDRPTSNDRDLKRDVPPHY
jgi:hypothetical protein